MIVVYFPQVLSLRLSLRVVLYVSTAWGSFPGLRKAQVSKGERAPDDRRSSSPSKDPCHYECDLPPPSWLVSDERRKEAYPDKTPYHVEIPITHNRRMSGRGFHKGKNGTILEIW